jgi:hypothetical protein
LSAPLTAPASNDKAEMGRRFIFYARFIVFCRERKSPSGVQTKTTAFMGGLADEDASFGNFSAAVRDNRLIRAESTVLWAQPSVAD